MAKFFKYPFQAYFSSAMVLTLLSCLLCLLIPNISLNIQQTLLGNLLPSFIYTGFLVTAMPSWHHFKGNITSFVMAIYVLLVLSYFLVFINLNISMMILAFTWLCLLVFSVYLMWRDKSPDNINLLTIILFIFLIQIGYSQNLSPQYLLSLLCAYLFSSVLVLFKISVMMGNEALKVTKLKNPIFIPNKIYRNLLASLLLLYVISNLYLDPSINGFIALGIGCLFLAKLKELHYREFFIQPYIKTYYFIQFSNAICFLYLGFLQVTQQPIEQAFNFLLISATFTSLCFMMLIIALRHCDINNLQLKDKKPYSIILLFFSASVPYLCSIDAYYQHTISEILLCCASTLFIKNLLPVFIQYHQKNNY